MWRTYVLGSFAVASLSLLFFLFLGNRAGIMRGDRAPIDKYIPSLSPLVQHTLQFLLVLAFLLAVLPQPLSKLVNFLRRFLP
jgi:hypothetical protein